MITRSNLLIKKNRTYSSILSDFEEYFKVAKSNMDIRPVYLSREERIDAHILTCFVSIIARIALAIGIAIQVARRVHCRLGNQCRIFP